MNKIKLAIDAHHLEGQRTGVGRYLENILKQWLKRRDLAMALIFKAEIPADEFLKENIFTCLLAPKLGLASTVLFQHLGLTRVLAGFKPDVFWGPGYLLPLLYPGKTLLTIHDIIYEAHSEWYSWPGLLDQLFLRKAGRYSAVRATRIITPSQFSKNEIMKYYGLPARRITVTPLAPDKRFSPALRRVRAVFKDLGIGDRYVLFVGALVNRRCLPILIQAFQLIEKKFPKLQLVLVGPDYTSPPLNLAAQFAAWNQGRRFKRYIHLPYASPDQLKQLYSFARATVALSLYEGFGLPIIEAMACGSPVIASATAAHPEVMGKAALAVADPTNVSALAQALTSVLTNQALRAKLRRRSLEQASRFSWPRTAAETLGVIQKLYAQPG